MLSTPTNIICEMKSMAVYSILSVMVVQFKAESNELSFSTASWKFENQPNDIHNIIGRHDILNDLYDMTHGDRNLNLACVDDEIHRAQNEINGECVKG